MYCSNCGHELRNKENFCPSCGKQIINNDTPVGKAQTNVSRPVTEVGKDIVSKEIVTLLAIIGICIVVALASIPIGIGLHDNSYFTQGYLISAGDIERYIDNQKDDYMKDIFMDTLKYSLIIIITGRYLFKTIKWSMIRTLETNSKKGKQNNSSDLTFNEKARLYDENEVKNLQRDN